MVVANSNDRDPLICFGVFHIENSECFGRHQLREKLISNIGDRWKNLDIDTVSFESLSEAETFAKKLNLCFEHVDEDRKPGVTGFMKGEIGIWIGTVLAIQKFLDSDFDIMVIFEDDVLSTKESIAVADRYLRAIPRRFDLFALYTEKHQHHIYGRKRHFRAFLRKRFFDNPDTLTRLYQHSCVAAYAISRKGAQKLLDSIEEKISMPIDWHLFRGRFKSFSFKPMGPKLFALAELESTIQNDRKIT
jgi:GR25 family glycosyltransferase involved in LPS biosynthesis